MLGKLAGLGLSALLTLAILAGGPGVWWYDRHFAGWSVAIGPQLPFHIPCCVIRLGVPAGIGPADAARLKAANAALAIAVGNERTLTAALNAQSAAVRAGAAQGRAALARAEAGVTRYRSASMAAAVRLAALRGPLTGDDMCSRVRDIDARLLETLK